MEPNEAYARFGTALMNAGINRRLKIADILEEPTKLVILARDLGIKLTDYVGQDFMGNFHKDQFFNAKLTEEGVERVKDIGRSIASADQKRAEKLAELGSKGIKGLYFELTMGDMLHAFEYEMVQRGVSI